MYSVYEGISTGINRERYRKNLKWLPREVCSDLYIFSFVQTPLPWRSACSGFSSPFFGRQRSPREHVPVYTPQDWPSVSAHVWQHPQPGSFTNWHPIGTGGHMESAFWSHGSHGTYEPQLYSLRRNVTRRVKLLHIFPWNVAFSEIPALLSTAYFV